MDNKPKIGVLGAGLMGLGIAKTHVLHNFSVVLYDVSATALENANSQLPDIPKFIWNPQIKSWKARNDGRFCEGEASRPYRLRYTCDLADLSRCDIIFESVPEKLKLKQKLYKQLSNFCENAILFTNTSTISVNELVKGWHSAASFCGFHFFHPIDQRPFAEIIPCYETSKKTVEFAKEHALKIGKRPLVVKDSPGFLVNRLLFPYFNEALKLHSEGLPIETIDRILTDYGMPKGPFQFMDEIGLDVTLHSGWIFAKSFPERAFFSDKLLSLVEARFLGCKTQRGFYSYPKPENPVVVSRKTISIVLERVLDALKQEAKNALNDGVVESLTDISVAYELGLAFPTLEIY